MRLIDLVKDGKKAYFVHYRDEEFIYRTDDGFEFPIPLSDIQGQKLSLLNEEKAIYFMRWIRRHLETIDREIVERNRQQGNMVVGIDVPEIR